jgi:hypothetical protein
MITSVTIQNFKNLRHLEIGLEPLTVFVGANGSGKTSVLEAIHVAVGVAFGMQEKVFASERHCDWLYTRGGQGDLSIKCTTPAGAFSVVATPPPDYPSPTVPLGKSTWELYPGLLEGDSRWEGDSRCDGDSLDEILRQASSLVFLHLSAAQLAKPSYSEIGVPRLKVDGWDSHPYWPI